MISKIVVVPIEIVVNEEDESIYARPLKTTEIERAIDLVGEFHSKDEAWNYINPIVGTGA